MTFEVSPKECAEFALMGRCRAQKALDWLILAAAGGAVFIAMVMDTDRSARGYAVAVVSALLAVVVGHTVTEFLNRWQAGRTLTPMCRARARTCLRFRG